MSVGPNVSVPYEAEAVYADVHTIRSEPLVVKAAGRRKTWLSRLMLVHSDVFALLFAYFAAERLFGSSTSAAGWTTAGGLFVLSLPLWLLAIKAGRLYARDDDVVQHTTLDEVPPLFQIATLGTWSFLVLTWIVSVPAPSMGQLMGFWLFAALLLPGVRVIARSEFQRDPDFPHNTVIVGAGSVGQLLARKMLLHPEYHLRLMGFVDAAPKERRDDLDDLQLLGTPEDLPRLIQELGVERVVVAFSNDSHEQTLDLIRLLRDEPVSIDIVPRLFDVLPPHLTNHTVEGIPLLTLPRFRFSPGAPLVKRCFDLFFSLLGLLLLAPFIALVALAIKLDSRGPVFFRQVRMGEGEHEFRMWKFRTMVADADERKAEVAHLNKHLQPGGDARMFKIQGDPRVTRVGAFLRRYSLDELPQLFNVVSGDMSLIGPRPLILEEDEHIRRWGRARLRLKPGMTGLWQVLGRSSIPFDEMVKLDYLYVTTWSLSGDFRLLLQTLPAVVRGERDGAY